MIEVKNLVKNYGRQTALDGVTFSVKDGEILGFLGPDGPFLWYYRCERCGKIYYYEYHYRIYIRNRRNCAY